MTTTQRGGGLYFKCDECQDFEVTAGDDFAGSWERLKDQGWRCTRDESTGKWRHFCPECMREWAQGQESGHDD